MRAFFFISFFLCLHFCEAQISGPSNICPGTIYTYTASTATLYTWSITGGSIKSGAGTKTITVIWGITGGQLHVITRADKFSEPMDFDLTAMPYTKGVVSCPVNRICPNTSTTLLLSGQNGPVDHWESSTNNGPWVSLSNTANLTSYSVSLSQSTSFRAVINAGACGLYYSDPATITVATPPTPTTPTVTQQCGSAILVAPVAPSGYTYFWQDNVNGTSAVNSIQNYTVTTSGNWFLRARDNVVGCWGAASGPITVNISQPAAPIATSVPRCGDGTVTLTASGPGTSYRWYYASGGDFIGETSSGTFNTPVLYGNTNFLVSSVINGCEGVKTAVSAIVYHETDPAPFTIDAEQCGSTIVRAPSAPYNYYTYYWETAANSTSTNSATLSVPTNTITNVNDPLYLRYYDNLTGCWSPSLAVKVNVKTVPEAPPVPEIQPGCTSAVLVRNENSVGLTYYWQPTDESTNTDNGGLTYTVTAGTYYLRAQSFNGCWGPATLVTATLKVCIEGQNRNYIVSNTLQVEGVTNETQIEGLSPENNARSISYIDGLSRPIQQISVAGSQSKQDIVQIMTYDAMGRETKKYLPFTTVSNGLYKENAFNDQGLFYSTSGPNSDRAVTATPWLESVVEESPLNRIKEQGAPGEDWQIGTGHTVKTITRPSAEYEVRLWNYDFTSGQCGSSGYYTAGELMVTENTDEQGVKTWNYTDKSGRSILAKRQIGTEEAQTYFIYDAFSQLRMVVQPEGVKQLISSGNYFPDASFIDKWCFTYAYDKFGRVTEKKLPGAAPVYMVYNKRHQPILSQDGVQRIKKQWSFIKYDAFNRVVLTGIYSPAAVFTQGQMQDAADAKAGQYERRTATNYSKQYGYTLDQSFPALDVSNSNINVVHYYDDYDYDNNSATVDAVYQPSGLSIAPVVSYETIGLSTGSRTRVLGTDQMLLTSLFYDKQGRLIQTQEANHMGGKDTTTNRFDFGGKLIESERRHGINGSSVVIKKRYEYDHVGRQLRLQQQINGGNWITVSTNHYNELGQLVEKDLHSLDNGQTFLQKVDYRYNIRGWLTKINDPNLSDSSDLFGMELHYNEMPVSQSGQVYYNGNISEMITNNRYENQPKAYAFTYDDFSRLTEARYAAKSNTGWNEKLGAYDERGISYDLNGNILTLQRFKFTTEHNFPQLTHRLTYNYIGNRLIKIDNGLNNQVTNPNPDPAPTQ